MAKVKVDEKELVDFVAAVKEFGEALNPIMQGRNSSTIRARYRASVKGVSDTADRLLSALNGK